eukprot:Gb_08622 [translate_table: standard]
MLVSDDEFIAVSNSLRDAQQNIQLFLQQQQQSAVDDYNDMNNNLQEDQQMPAMEDEELQKLQESIHTHSPASIDSSYGNPVGVHCLQKTRAVRSTVQTSGSPAPV